jgi:hypothetical protein
VVVLLDENLDHRLRLHLSPHEVFTVAFRGWSGLKNGTLLRTAEESGIEVFLTGDQTLAYEQNLAGRRIAIVVLSSIELPILRGYLGKIRDAIDSAEPGSLQLVDCVVFRRGVL